MITVKTLLPLLRDVKGIKIAYGGYCKEIDINDVLDVDAYGPYVVDRIMPGLTQGEYELHIAFQPIKVTEV